MRKTLAVIALMATAGLTLTACGGESDEAKSDTPSTSKFNDADVSFAQQMVPHHEQAIEKAMRPHAAGAAVVVDVRTGRLLAVYGKPDFDPNDLSGGAGRDRMRETFNKLYTDPLKPMLDKTMSGSFQPGSTFKPFSALAALEDKIVDPNEHERCDGYLNSGRRIFHCTHVHGRVNMHEAIAESCNIYFFKIAPLVTMDRIARVATEFGLGSKTGIGVNPESPGRIPTRSWYNLHYKGQFQIGFTLNTAIGQGATTVTPLRAGASAPHSPWGRERRASRWRTR